MQFFERQQNARRLTTLFRVQFTLVMLVGLLVFTVALPLALAPLTRGATLAFSLPFIRLASGMPINEDSWQLMIFALLIATAVFIAAVLFQRILLANSHAVLTRKLGCAAVSRKHADGESRRLLNIVDEMALAAGIPSPAVYIWENHGINAMAVGARVADAKLVISRGCLDNLNRDEVQSVVAHEFSHILNGDMPLNLRIAAFVSALSMTWRLGVFFVMSPRHAKGALDWIKAAFAWLIILLWVGLILCALGAPHFLGARLLQAAICREREKLADASAIQFTRQPLSLKTALMKAEVLSGISSRLPSKLAGLAHLCFTDARAPGLFATHPGIEERLRAIDPRFRLAEIATLRDELAQDMARRRAARVAEFTEDARSTPTQQTGKRDLAAMLLVADASLAAADPVTPIPGARPEPVAWLLALLLEADDVVRHAQLDLIERRLGLKYAAQADAYLLPLRVSTRAQRLAELRRLLPELRELQADEQRRLHALLFELESLDQQVDVFEYALARTATTFLADLLVPNLPRESLQKSQVIESLQVLFSVVAQCGHVGDAGKAATAYAAAMSLLIPHSLPPLLDVSSWSKPLDQALNQLDRLTPVAKQGLIRALHQCVHSDGNVTPGEFALVQAISAALHCPLLPEGPQ